jgi:hypothetical protein
MTDKFGAQSTCRSGAGRESIEIGRGWWVRSLITPKVRERRTQWHIVRSTTKWPYLCFRAIAFLTIKKD